MAVKAENIYYLLSYAWDQFTELDLAEIPADEQHDACLLLTRVLVSAVRRLVRQGLDRGYREHHEELRRPRGRIDLAASLPRAGVQRGVLACHYDDQTLDVPHNRIIGSMLRRLRSVESMPVALSHSLRHQESHFVGVSPVDLSADIFRQLRLPASLRRYRLAIGLCEILDQQLLPVEGVPGRFRMHSFGGDARAMGRLFETFVRAFLERETLWSRVTKESFDWQGGPHHALVPRLEADVVLWRPGHVVVMETKCYEHPLDVSRYGGAEKLRSRDICQLTTYLANMPRPRAEPVTGVLCYGVDRDVVPAIDLTLNGHRLLVRSVNLNRPWREIHAAMQALSQELWTMDCSVPWSVAAGADPNLSTASAA